MRDSNSLKPTDNLAHDVPSSLVVFLVALPLCLGIALASGAPLFSGLIAGTVGGIVAGLLSKSSVSVSGPAAGLSTVVFAAITDLGSFSVFLACVVIAGIIQVVLGFWKAGTIGHFFPIAVVKGMLSAIGLILILKQLPHAVGYDVDYEGDEAFLQPDGRNTFTELLSALDSFTTGAIVISIFSLLILLFWDRMREKGIKWIRPIPGPLVVVIVGVALNTAFINFVPYLALQQVHLVSIPGIDNGIDFSTISTLPDFGAMWNKDALIIAFTIAIIASLETLLSIEASDKLDPFKRTTPLNHELKAQGVANIVSGMLGGLPVTAVIVRSSANIQAGARTKVSAILHGVLMIVIVLTIPHLLQLIPLASLAGILLVVGYKLTSPSLYREMLGKGKEQFLPFLVTIVATLFSDILIGIFIGSLVSVFFVLRATSRSAVILVGSEGQFLIRFTKDVSFVHKSSLRQALERIPGDSNLIIDESKSNVVDADIRETIDDFVKAAPSKNISVEVKRANGSNHHELKQHRQPIEV